jgi:hypothetical protein
MVEEWGLDEWNETGKMKSEHKEMVSRNLMKKGGKFEAAKKG